MTRLRLLFVTSMLLPVVTPTVRADLFLLKSGGRVEGDLLTTDEGPSKGHLLVQTTDGGTIKLATSQVERVVRRSEAELQYQSFMAKMSDTPENHWLMADWCQKNGLRKQREFHLEQVLKHEPDHEEARHGLGYSKVDGRWMKTDEWMESQGYVRNKGAWRLRQEVLLEETAQTLELAEKKWRMELRIWRRWLNKSRHQEAINNFRAVDDPLAAMGLADLLATEPLREMKLLYIEVLGKLDSPKAKAPLIKASVEDDSERVRDACLDELQRQGGDQATGYLLSMLDPAKNPDNQRINRAGIALGRLGDQAVIAALIDALVTEHVQRLPPPGGGLGIGATFSKDNPGGGLSLGGRIKPVQVKVRNEGVLYGLKALTGQDFRFDQNVWRRWLVEAYTPKDVRLRRDR